MHSTCACTVLTMHLTCRWQKPRELLFDSNRVHVYCNTVALCVLYVLGSRLLFPKVHVFFSFFLFCADVCFDSMPTQHCCFFLVRVMFHVVHVPRRTIRFGTTLPQLPSRRAVWGGLTSATCTDRPVQAALVPFLMVAWGISTCPKPWFMRGDHPVPQQPA
jgi:hypothetical protein